MASPGPELHTARLRLRPLAAVDVDALHALWTDPQVRRFLWDDRVSDRATTAQQVAARVASFAQAGWGLWALEPRAGGALLGVAGLVLVDPALGPELLYALAPEHQGVGYATEAAAAVLAHAFRDARPRPDSWRTDAPHRASARVMERFGMRFEGERLVNGAPLACYALARADWARGRGRAHARARGTTIPQPR